jgi:polar amino acid transport system substrate-binding protein
MANLTRFLGVLVLCLAPGADIATAKVRVGIAAEPYPPFLVKDASGEWVGWEIDFMNAVCREMKEKCEIIEVAWDGLILSVRGNFIDVIWSSMTVTPERQKLIDFTNLYYNLPIVIIGAKNGDKDISPQHLKGKTIGVQGGTIHQGYVERYFGVDSNIKTYQTHDEATQDLTAGRIDYMQGDLLALDAFLQTDQGTTCCELKGIVPDDPELLGLGVAAGLRKGDTQLKERFNVAIKAVHDSGEYSAITRKYSTFDVWPK